MRLVTRINTHDEDVQHAARKRPEFQHRSLAAAWMLRTGLRAWSGRPTEAALRRDKHGRPCSSTGEPHLSIAHDDLTVAVAFAAHNPVGIDIEPRSRHVPAAVVDLLEPVGERDALAAWTTYEAIAKADGRGIGLPVAHLARISTSKRWRLREGDEYVVTHRELGSGSLLAVAWRSETPPLLAIATADGVSQDVSS